MGKNEFVKQLKLNINHLPKTEQTRIISFYEEMIDDKIENGMNVEEAIASIELENFSLLTQEQKKDITKMICYILGSPVILLLYLSGFFLCLSGYILVGSLLLIIFASALELIVGISQMVYFLFQDPILSLYYFGFTILIVGLGVLSKTAYPFLLKGVNQMTIWLKNSMVSYGKVCLGYEK